MTHFTFHHTTAGRLLLLSDGRALTGLHFDDGKHVPVRAADWVESDAPFTQVRGQLDAYFAGRRRAFDLPLAPQGTPFQQRVWQQLCAIPYGETRSYAQIASALGNPAAVRAAAAANGRNRISIIIPCHRVIGSSGALTGYAGGLERKAALLRLEGAG